MHSISWTSDIDFGKDIMFVLGSYDHFSHNVLPSFFTSFVTMSSSKPIGARRMSEWYKEFTDKDDDPHSPFSNSRERHYCWDEQIVIPETRAYRK